MMFTPPRFVVIDDRPTHAQAIASSVQELGSSCAVVVYSAEVDVPANLFVGVRVIFMDLQLLSNAMGDFKLHYAEIQRILGQVINPDGGPYMLVVWTDAIHRADGLSDYLEEHLFSKKKHTRPLSILPLSKHEYIDTTSGTPVDSFQLGRRILSDIRSTSAAAALMQWESDVLAATSGVLQTIMSIAADGQGVVASLPAVLKRVASDAAGPLHAVKDPGAALHMALLPLLQDQIQNGTAGEHAGQVWHNAFSDAPEDPPRLSREKAANLNTHLHLKAPSDSAAIDPASWGAVSHLEESFSWSDFGMANAQEFVGDFVVPKVRTAWSKICHDTADESQERRVRIGQVRVGAACDYAQKSSGPIPYALVAFIPAREEVGKRNVESTERSSAWISPLMDVPGWGRGHLFVDPRFVRTRGSLQAESFVSIVRLREQLLIELIASISRHGSRPGITQFVGEDTV